MKTKLFFVCQRKSGELYMEKERCRTTTIAADKYRSYRLFFILDPFCFGFFSGVCVLALSHWHSFSYCCIWPECYFFRMFLLQLCSFVAIIHIRLPLSIASPCFGLVCIKSVFLFAGLSFHHLTLSSAPVGFQLYSFLFVICHVFFGYYSVTTVEWKKKTHQHSQTENNERRLWTILQCE